MDDFTLPRCVIIEQPARRQARFRYAGEGRWFGSLLGASSTLGNKTYPTIRIEGYTGEHLPVVVVSCVTVSEPYRPHPNKLIGREECKQSICTMFVPKETMTLSFKSLQVQCVKRKQVEEALTVRQEIKVDPFKTGFDHKYDPDSIDLTAVRLCFQVFLSKPDGQYTQILPVVSNPIYDTRFIRDLVITKLSDYTCPVDGGDKDIILLCGRVKKEDIRIRFFEVKDGKTLWEDYGEFHPSQIHKKTAIWFRPPKYLTLNVKEPIKMFVQLERRSDNFTSAPIEFEMTPLYGKRKVVEYNENNLSGKRMLLESGYTQTPNIHEKLNPLIVEDKLDIPKVNKLDPMAENCTTDKHKISTVQETDPIVQDLMLMSSEELLKVYKQLLSPNMEALSDSLKQIDVNSDDFK